MSPLTLAVNCGSSSIKFKLFSSSSSASSSSREEEHNVILSGSAKNVQQSNSTPSFTYTYESSSPKEISLDSEASYEETFEQILNHVLDVLKEKKVGEQIEIVCHRIVHGGTASEPIVIRHGTKEEEITLKKMDEVSGFAPLHNHHAMLIVKSCLSQLPKATSVLCFDTLFHTTIPKHRTIYPISSPDHKTPVPLRRYGFHGLSYSNILDQMSSVLSKPRSEISLVIAHLGSGGSCCLIERGRSIDTTMGLTPLEGLPGGTRSGSLDPSLIFHHTPDCSSTVKWSGREISKAEYVLNKESGFKALAGTSDFGQIIKKYEEEADEKFELTYKLYLYKLLGFLSAYIVEAMNRDFDALVFSGGIGERSARLRKDVLAHFEWVEKLAGTNGGVDVDSNEKGKGRRRLTKEGSKIPAWIVETNEELECVRLAHEAVKKM